MYRSIQELHASRRAPVSLALALQLSMVIGVGDPALAKGEALVGFERRYYVPGDVAYGRLGVSEEVVNHPPTGQLSVYLIPWRQWKDDRFHAFRTLPMFGDRVLIHGDTAVVRFEIRRVPWGRYRVGICQRGGPCGRGRIDDFRNGSIHVVSDRESIPTWRTLADVNREAEVLQATLKQHGDLLRVRGERLEALEARVQELDERLEGETTTDPRARGPAGWVVATWTVLLAVGMFGLVGRRKAHSKPSVLMQRFQDESGSEIFQGENQP
jgi:hypothetical protein